MNPAASESDLMVSADHAEIFSELKCSGVVLAERPIVGARDEAVGDADTERRGLVEICVNSEFAEIGEIGRPLHDIRAIHAASEVADRTWTNQICIAKNKLIHTKR